MDEAKQSIKPCILVVEDELAIRLLLRTSMGVDFRLIEAESGTAGLDLVAKRNPDVILLDLGLPGLDGMDVIKTIRGWSNVPIIVVSGQNEEPKKVAALEAGADDFVTKPFGVEELIARIRVALRRTLLAESNGRDPIFESAQLRLDRSLRKVWVHEEEVHLSPIEYKLLCALVAHAGQVLTHRQLLVSVWGQEYSEDSQYLRVYIGYLRKKLEPSPTSQKLLLTEPRIGYRLVH